MHKILHNLDAVLSCVRGVGAEADLMDDLHCRYRSFMELLRGIQHLLSARFLKDDEVQELERTCRRLRECYATEFPRLRISPKLHNLFGK